MCVTLKEAAGSLVRQNLRYYDTACQGGDTNWACHEHASYILARDDCCSSTSDFPSATAAASFQRLDTARVRLPHKVCAKYTRLVCCFRSRLSGDSLGKGLGSSGIRFRALYPHICGFWEGLLGNRGDNGYVRLETIKIDRLSEGGCNHAHQKQHIT